MSSVFDSLGADLRALFPNIRLLGLSLHDAEGDPLWMSEGVLGPDEHALTLDGLDVLRLEPVRRCFERAHGDGAIGMVFPARDPAGQVRGAATVVAESRSLDGTGQEKALNPRLQALLQRLAVQLRSRDAASETAARAALAAGSDDATVLAPVPQPPTDQRFADLALFVQQMLRLKTSGRTRRYEVLLRSRRGSSEDRAPVQLLQEADEPASQGLLDRYVVAQLVEWLELNRATFEAEPASFSVNLSLGALVDPTFLEYVAQLLSRAQVNPRMIAFELREQVCRERAGDVQRFVRQCERLKCQVVIDDFTLHTDVLPLLRSPAVRLVKIDAALTSAAMKDKLSQALVVGISQACKVLGAHCVAKRIESAIARQWLSAIGVDFAQGFLLEGLVPLATLGGHGGAELAPVAHQS